MTDHSANSLVRRRCATRVNSFLREAEGAPLMLARMDAADCANGCPKLHGGTGLQWIEELGFDISRKERYTRKEGGEKAKEKRRRRKGFVEKGLFVEVGKGEFAWGWVCEKGWEWSPRRFCCVKK